MADAGLIAKYPFLSESKKFVGEGKPGDLEVREAVFFARECFERKEHVPKDARRDALSMLLSRLMLYFLGPGFLRKFAFFKAREYAMLFQKEEEGVLLEIARDFFPSLEKKPDGTFKVSIVDYLQYGRSLPEAGVSGGMVFFDKGELLACLRTAVEVRICDYEKLDARLPENLKSAALGLKDAIPREFAPKQQGKYLQRPELQNILKGVGEGKRYYGAMALAIACLKDGLAREEALELVGDYVENCAKGSHPFSHREGESVVDWVYKHPGINFSFTMLKSQGLGE